MNLRYQETFCIIFLLCTSITLAEDFDFVPEQNDDVEPIAAEPPKVDSQPKLSKAGVRCLPTESTIQLSLILRAKSWKHVQTSLKQRTISKLAEYFLVPEESIIVRDATSNDLHKMVEKALQHGKKPSRTVGKSLGWIGFPVGCGEKMSSSAKETVRNVNTQLAELRDLTGMDFGCWVIWKEQTGGAAASDKRIKREVDPDDDYYDYDDDEAAEDDDEGETTEVPHAHRHHHGSSEQYSTKAEHHSSPTHATNKHTTNNPDHTVETHHHQQHHHHHQQQHRHHANAEKQAEPWPRGGAATGEHRKSPVMVSLTAPSITAATTQPSQPKRKHNHGLYDQVKERSAKKQAAALLAHTHQSDRAFQPATEPSHVAVHPFTPPDLRESVSQLESTISKTIANNEQLKKDEETLLARKAKHKRIDIERIVETELLLPEIERLQDEVFRDDYVIEDVVRGPKFYDFSTQPQLDRFVPLEPEPEKRQPATSPTTTLPASVNRSPTTVKPQYVTVEKTTTPPMPTTSKQVPATTPNSKLRTSPTQAVSTLTVPRRHTDESLFTTKLPHPAITPVVSSIDADEDAPSRSDTTTTIGTINPTAQSRLVPPTKLDPTTTTTTTTLSSTPARSAAKTTTMTTTTATATSTRAKTIPTELIELQTSPATMPLTTTTTTASTTSTTVSEEPTNPTATTTTTTTTPASSASATNTRSTNLFASVPLVKPTSTQRSVSTFTTPKQDNEEEDKELEYENYDDEYDDEEEGAIELTTQPDPRVLSSTTTTERPMPSSTEPSTTPTTVTMPTTTPSTTTTTTTEAPTTTTTTTTSTTTTTTTTTTEASTTTSTMLTTELDEPTNLPPIIRNRIPKQAIPAGKVFRYQVPLETFHDNEDGNNLSLELLDARDQPLKPSSWIQFNEDTKEIYGLPLEKDVSRWPYKLRATDSGNLTVTEKVDIQVQQHKSHRSLNHEISLALRLNRKFASNVDWHIETARGISVVLGDVTLSNIIVRDIRNSIQDPSLATFVYTNETLPKDRCPEEKLDELVALLTEEALNDALNPDITVKSVQGQQIAQCTKVTPPKVKPTQSIQRNYAPQTRNQVDQVNATVGHLLVFKVPVDTFYDPEDGNELKMKLLTTDRNTLDPNHWLQFDSKNQEFYGVPRTNDIGRKEYLLMAEDREGLTATDALVVVVNPHHKRDYSVLFELTLDISHEQFNTAQVQRRFIERLAQVFGDASTHYIKIHHIRPIHHTGQVQVSFFNTTLSRQHQRCPQEEIETLRNILLHQDSTIRAKVREILGQEFSLQNVSLVPLDNCHGFDTPHHATSEPEKAAPKPISKDDYLLTFVLPSVIIIVMLLIAAIIACILYKRRLTGKMELEYINFKPIASSSSSNPQGTDEERKSFRSKGIPVIFQDELDEKPEIGNKSPVILKDEKPPLLPPSYSSTNHDGDNEDVDEYVPPQPVIVGGRESRGKSPVTPSYRRPPPYVSP
ncbi:uncharacterized protein LOC1274848 isoform X4 [Anopheles gambiae]|uniref:uncharacterized protein LOC1274848 isoform X4 n=1 Tax=Anopheles gambiae TaxID=7165 RepID=UPI002AC8D59C|nr:uncharacterized protein LOC1274848 isoform X4 [Anopheles gambiae]